MQSPQGFACLVLCLGGALPAQTSISVINEQFQSSGSCFGPFSSGCGTNVPPGGAVAGGSVLFCCGGTIVVEHDETSVEVTGLGLQGAMVPPSDWFSLQSRLLVTFTPDYDGVLDIMTSGGDASVDVGLDGIDASGNSQVLVSIPGGQPTRVRLRCNIAGSCAGPFCSTTSASVWVEFVPSLPPSATTFAYGTGCGGATLSVVDTPFPGGHELEFALAGAMPNAQAFVAIGFVTATIPIPFAPGCDLLTQPAIVALMAADAAGDASSRLAFSSPFSGQFYVQAIPVDFATGEIRASAGVAVSVSD